MDIFIFTESDELKASNECSAARAWAFGTTVDARIQPTNGNKFFNIKTEWSANVEFFYINIGVHNSSNDSLYK